MMAFVAVSFSAAAQKGNFNVKAGLGVANWLSNKGYEENCNYKLNWKVGGGFEFRVCKLIGIEPSVMLNSKGTKWEWEGVKFSRTANLLYLETPIMCNFHIGEKWSLGAGVYFATLVDDNNTKYDYPQFALPLYNLCSNVGLYETAAITNRSNILSPKYLRLNL